MSDWTAEEAESFERWARSWCGRLFMAWCDFKWWLQRGAHWPGYYKKQ